MKNLSLAKMLQQLKGPKTAMSSIRVALDDAGPEATFD